MPRTNRNTLKEYFKRGSMPNQKHFYELIDSMVNISDDGIDKNPDDGLRLAPSKENSPVISLFTNIQDNIPEWKIYLGNNSQLHIIRQGQDEPILSLHPNGRIEMNQPGMDIRINGSLSAHGCICSSQKCGRIIDKRYASAICSCQKSCQIRNNTSADCNHSTISAEPFFQHGIFNLRLRLSGLTFFSCGKYEQFHFKSSLAQLFTDWFCIQIQYIGIRDHGKLPDFSQKTGL